MKLINNKDTVLLSELKQVLTAESEVYITSAYASHIALFELVSELSACKGVKIILGETPKNDPRFGYDPDEFALYYDLRAVNKARKVYELIEHKCQVRCSQTGGQCFILVRNGQGNYYFSFTPRNLNAVTLGLLPATGPLVIQKLEDSEGVYLGLFDQFWVNSSRDLKEQLLEKIQEVSKDNTPDYLYKYTLYHIFKNSSISEENEQRISKTGFKNTQIWNMLFNFQKDAVIGAIDKIETFGGCIIADSVGLGKTFEALAIMKYYQLRNDRILVLAPKKLRDNWLVYSQNDIQNILSQDRFNFDVLNHTDLSRETGYSGNINLETINWGNYDLVVIDESHNFRNNPQRRNVVTRYQRLMNFIIKSGVKTKVLMLSATPVNTRMTDIKNQIAFITEQNDQALEMHGISSIDLTLRKAQAKFNTWLKQSGGQTANRQSLIDGLDGAYFKLLDLLTIARSRKHIEKYYDVNDIGKFPERLPPINRYTDFDRQGVLKAMDKVNDELNALNLGFYSPLSYVRDDKKPEYEQKYNIITAKGTVFRQIEREDSLIHLMRVNLLKRLESSVHSFRLTLGELLKQIDAMLAKIEKANKTDYFDEQISIQDIDTDDALLEDLLAGGRVKVLLQDMDLLKCGHDLKDDRKRLENLLAQTQVIDLSRDAKLEELKTMIREKVHNNLNPGNNKVIVFSAFSDTVQYLYNNLADWAKEELGLYSGQIVGGNSSNKTNLPGCKADFSHILINFSPRSKKRQQIFPNASTEIDLLFCTDCISEGQNLQDADYLVNYDIHWNPVRIVQRFGRIDRIGSVNAKIQLVNFFPNLELDTYIGLISRVKGRMQILDVSATGDDNIIEESQGGLGDLDYRKRQLKAMQSKVLDLEDIEGGISITDLTFNDFKIDAERLSHEERLQFEAAPKALYALTENPAAEAPKGVIFCLRNLQAESNENNTYSAIHPYSLCYVQENGNIFVPGNNPKRCLDYYKKLCLGRYEVQQQLLAGFNKQTRMGSKIEPWNTLLQQALAHLRGVDEEAGLDSLALPGGTRMSKRIHNDAFEIISYLIVY